MSSVVEFDDALGIVLKQAAGLRGLDVETVGLPQVLHRVLAENVAADRNQPPFDRATRDGFAVRAAEAIAGELKVVGQVRAGERWVKALGQSEAVEIMTGAPVPNDADAVVMVEHVERTGSAMRMVEGRVIRAGENVVRRGSEARTGEAVLTAGTLMGAAEIALAASCGAAELKVYRQPKVAILATGDELVEVNVQPKEHQIRNSNSYALAALVKEAGGEPVRMSIVSDERGALERRMQEARACDLMLLSGGVSMGKYDLVEEVLLDLGAEFFFTGVKMQPGKPVVFGSLPAKGELPERFFFGLPGNPISVQVTFHCFVAPLLRAMAGGAVEGPRFAQATLAEDVAGKPELVRLLPARLTSNRIRPAVKVVGWQGSGDLAANARANCYAIFPPDRERFISGDVISVLLR